MPPEAFSQPRGDVSPEGGHPVKVGAVSAPVPGPRPGASKRVLPPSVVAVVFFFVICGIVGSLVGGRMASTWDISWLDAVFGVLGLVVSSVIAIAMHEVGHMLGGWLSGYRLMIFSLLLLAVQRTPDGWRVSRSPAGMPYSGCCLMEPTVPEERFRFGLFGAGGFLMNFIMAVICWGACVVFDLSGIAAGLLETCAMVNAIAGFGNAIPLSIAVNNDGAALFDALRSRCQGRDRYRVLMVTAQLTAGVRVKDIDAALLDSPTDPPCDCSGGRARMAIQAQQVDILGDHIKASQILSALLAKEKGSFNRGQLLGGILYNYLVYGVDSVPVPDPSDPALAKILKLKLPGVYQMKAAISYYIEHDQAKALKELDEAERTLSALGNADMIAETKDELDMLRARFTAEVSPVNDTVTQPGDKVSD